MANQTLYLDTTEFNENWLLTDNAVVASPALEKSTSGRRVRVKGTSKSVPYNDAWALVNAAVDRVAAQRGAARLVKIPAIEVQRSKHGGCSPTAGNKPTYTSAADVHLLDANKRDSTYNHTQFTFEFESVEVPGIIATVWVVIDKPNSASQYRMSTGLTYMDIAPGMTDDYSRWTRPETNSDTGGWYCKTSRYDDEYDAVCALLQQIDPLPGINMPGTVLQSDTRHIVIEALRVLKQLRDVESVVVPVWRSNTPEPMEFKFKRTNFTNSVYQDMFEHTQVAATMEQVRQTYKLLQDQLRELGFVLGNERKNEFKQVAEKGFGSDLVTHMLPVTESDEQEEPDKPTIVADPAHSVSIDMMTGTIVVLCTHSDNPNDVAEAWEFQRFQAELKGELPAFLGFARSNNTKRHRATVKKIVQARTISEELDLRI